MLPKIKRMLVVVLWIISNSSPVFAQNNPEKNYPIKGDWFCKSKYAGMLYPCVSCKRVLWMGGILDDTLIEALMNNGIKCSDEYWDPEGYSHVILKACERNPTANTVEVIDFIIENFKNKYTSKAKCLEE